MVLQGRDICSSKQKQLPNSSRTVTQIFSEEALEKKNISTGLHWHLRLPIYEKDKEPCLRLLNPLIHKSEETQMFPFGAEFFFFFFWLKAVMWSLSTSSTSYRKITLFLKLWRQTVLRFLRWREEKILILYWKFKWCCSDSNLANSWEKFKMRAEGSYSVPPQVRGREDTWAP